jgi:hypothetical protein
MPRSLQIGVRDPQRTARDLGASYFRGYHKYGVNSPYLYGGSTLYGPPEAKAGKYIRDHVFDRGVNDKQLGALVLLKVLPEVDTSIKLSRRLMRSSPRGIPWGNAPEPVNQKPAPATNGYWRHVCEASRAVVWPLAPHFWNIAARNTHSAERVFLTAPKYKNAQGGHGNPGGGGLG